MAHLQYKVFKAQSGWILIYTLAISVVMFIFVVMGQGAVLEIETTIQLQKSNFENDRLSRAALIDIENTLRKMLKRPAVTNDETPTINLNTANNWIVQSNIADIPELKVSTDRLTPGRSLHWWEQPKSWWEENTWRYTLPFALKPDQSVHVFVVQRGFDHNGMDLSVNTLYALSPEVIVFEIYVRSQSGKGSIRRNMSLFSRAFY